MQHKKLLVEFLGTMLLCLVALKTGNWMAIVATLTGIIYFGGPISGGSFNPAVTIALMVSHKLSQMDAIKYIVAEVAGALVGFAAYKLVK